MQEKGITHNDFLQSLGYRSNKKRYDDLHINDIVGRWKIIGVGKSRKSGKNKNIPYWICQCTCGSEIIREVSDNALKRRESLSCGCIQQESISNLKGTFRKQSFYDWCKFNNHGDFLDRWDYSLNKVNPQNISYCSKEKIYFKCSCGKHKSAAHRLNHVSNMKEFRCKYCDSFAQRFIDTRGENALELYWDYDKNTKDPWEISASSSSYVWLKCTDTDYHGSYKISRDNAIRNGGCPYCSHRKIHSKDSFGQYLIDKYGENAINEIWDSEKNTIDPFTIAPSTRKHKIWLKCNKIHYHPSTYCYPNNIHNHSGHCHYCSKQLVCKEDSLGYLYPEVLNIWSDKNKKSPYENYPTSSINVWWKCENGKHEDYQRRISDANRYGFRCPECVNERNCSSLQEKVATYINTKYNYKILHENKCNIKPRNPKTNYFLFYDNEVVDLKLIIEVHGKQHYEICGFTYLTARHYNITLQEAFTYSQWKDNYKEQYAKDKGYSYLIIPYWTEQDESYKKLIDNKIQEILQEAA